MATLLNSFWVDWSRGARIAAMGAAALGIALAVWAAMFAFREDYRVLFSDLVQSDAAAIVGQLKKDKVPYRLSEGGTVVSVPAEQVHDIRLGLMTSDLPLSGGVGFEIFDKQGLGTTEQSQKVSYQRALQGELTRTIGSIEGVRQVRVHLVLPESTLFSRDRQQASAAVNVGMHAGAALERQQIVGVQRLVAAAVPGLDPSRVVVTDQRGITLSSGDAASQGAGAAEARFEVKSQIEEYVALKVARLLDGAFGPGQAIVSVDVSLNFDATKTTIEDLLPASGDSDGIEGRIVRRRQVTGASTTEPIWTTSADGGQTTARTPGSSVDIEYEYGRRIDEIIAAPGSVSRISVGVIVPPDVTEEQRHRISELVHMAAGLSPKRGDAVSVQTLYSLAAMPASEAIENHDSPPPEPTLASASASSRRLSLSIGYIAAAIVGAMILAWAFGRSGGRATRALSTEERAKLLAEVQHALRQETAGERGRP